MPEQASDTDNYYNFAWDGISFDVPETWNLSDYRIRPKGSHLEMEDDYYLRLHLEWIRPQQNIKPSIIEKKWVKVGRMLIEDGAQVAVIEDVPANWSTVMYSLPDNEHLVCAYYLLPDKHFFCFSQVHFYEASKREPRRVIKKMISSFKLHNDKIRPWQVYDVGFNLNSDFHLVNTSLQAGQKLLVFEWRLRRLYLCFISLADVILKNKSPASWSADFLNKSRILNVPKFLVDQNNSVIATRKGRYPLGHFEEIGRMCFKYYVDYIHLPKQNQLVLLVFNYRKKTDLQKLKMNMHPS
jgi:hypothetical protein